MTYSAGYESDGSWISCWEGSKEECLAYMAGAHLGAVNDYLTLRSDKPSPPIGSCACGPHRKETRTQGDEVFLPRVGCLTCNAWDTGYIARRP